MGTLWIRKKYIYQYNYTHINHKYVDDTDMICYGTRIRQIRKFKDNNMCEYIINKIIRDVCVNVQCLGYMKYSLVL